MAYTTSTTPPLTLLSPIKEENGDWVVVLRGDRDKELYRGANWGKAMSVYTETMEMYKARKKAER